MSVYKKDGKWYFKGKIKNEYGEYKDYNRLAKNSRTKKEAINEESQFISLQTGNGITNSKLDLTFGEISDLYFVEMVGKLKTSTIETNKEVLNKLKFLKERKIRFIKAETIRIYLIKMDQDGYKLNYIDKVYNTVNKIFKYALKNKYISENPLAEIERIKRADDIIAEMQFYNYDQYKWLKKASDFTNPYDVLINLLYLHGCRKGEALALTWNDVDMDKKTIKINKTLTIRTGNNTYKITPPKTKNSIRVCKMCEELYDIMIKYREIQSKLIGFNKDRFVFGYDAPLASTTIDRRKKDLINKANNLIKEYNNANNKDIELLPNIRIHDLRHSHASLLINNGANILAVAKRLGDTTETVMKVYAHMFLSSENELIDILNNIYKQ